MSGSPAKIPSPSHSFVVLACDGALRFLKAADDAGRSGDAAMARINVENARRTLLELMGALDPAVAPGATESLAELYQALLDRLANALKGDLRAVTETRLDLTRLRNAWAEAGRTASSPVRR